MVTLFHQTNEVQKSTKNDLRARKPKICSKDALFHQKSNWSEKNIKKKLFFVSESVRNYNSNSQSWIRILRMWQKRLAHSDCQVKWTWHGKRWCWRLEFACSAQVQLSFWNLAKRRWEHSLFEVQASGRFRFCFIFWLMLIITMV